MPEIARVAGAVSTVAACVALVASGLITVTQNDRVKGHMAAYILQKWYKSVRKKKAHAQDEPDSIPMPFKPRKEYKDVTAKDLEQGDKYEARRKNLPMRLQRSYVEENQQELHRPTAKHQFSDSFQNKELKPTFYEAKNWRERKRREMCPTCSLQPAATKQLSPTTTTTEPQSFSYLEWPSWYERRRASLCPVCYWKTEKVPQRAPPRKNPAILSLILPSSGTGMFGAPSPQSFRKCLALVSESVKAEHAARIIQRWYRCLKTGWILTTFRSWSTPIRQREEVIRDLMKHSAAVVIQGWFRHHTKRRYALHYVHLHASAYVIQKWQQKQWLRWHMLHYVHICAAVVTVQKWYRRMRRIDRMHRYVHLCNRADLIKRWYRNQKLGRGIEEYAKRKKAVTKIQDWWIRLYKATIIDAYLILNKNAVKVQKWYKRQLKIKAMLKYAENHQKVVVLQRIFRKYIKIQAVNNYICQQDSARIIQRWYGRLRKRKYVLHYLHLLASALAIQSWYCNRKKIGHALHYLHQNAAASVIQRWFRHHVLRTRLMHYAHCVAAANAIQHWYIVCKKRSQLMRYLATHRRTSILKSYTEFFRRNGNINYLKKCCKSSILQKWYKDDVKRKFVLDYFRMDEAAVKIQRWYRRVRIRRLIVNYLEVQCVACKIHKRYLLQQKWIKIVRMALDNSRINRGRNLTWTNKARHHYIEVEAAAETIRRGCREWLRIKEALSAISKSMHNWYYSIDEEEAIRAYQEARIRQMKLRKICERCATRKLYRTSSKIRMASAIFVVENAIVIIQRWWRKVRLANSMIREAKIMQSLQVHFWKTLDQ